MKDTLLRPFVLQYKLYYLLTTLLPHQSCVSYYLWDSLSSPGLKRLRYLIKYS